jgi:hypothetical protein
MLNSLLVAFRELAPLNATVANLTLFSTQEYALRGVRSGLCSLPVLQYFSLGVYIGHRVVSRRCLNEFRAPTRRRQLILFFKVV